MRLSAAGGLDYNFGQRRSVRTADPRVSPRSVGPAVRTNDLSARAVAGIKIKVYIGYRPHIADFHNSRRQADRKILHPDR